MSIASLAHAQRSCVNGIRVDGTITDPTGAVIPGAQVRAASGEIATADTAGHYVLLCVPATSTILTAQADGFARGTASARGHQGGIVHVNLQLPIASVQTDVQVGADAPGIDNSSGAGTTVLGTKEIQQLPDDPDDLLQALQTLAASSGGNPAATVIVVDGFQSPSAMPPKSSIASIRINPDFFAPEYQTPNWSGGRIEITTKPGADTGGKKGGVSSATEYVLVYAKDNDKAKTQLTYWADEDYEIPLQIDTQSWDHEESGHSQSGINELDAVVGKGHAFKTVKPLRLFKKIIQIWCRAEGVVFDPFAGSGTTAQAVLELNNETAAQRRFILIEQGNTDKGDHYAKTLTAERARRVITGDWASGKHDPLPGGFRFIELKREKIDAEAVNALAREEMIDLLLTSYWDKAEKARSYLRRFPAGAHQFLFAVNPKEEGFFLVWQAANAPSVLNRDVFKAIVAEAKTAKLASKYHVYASIAPYTGAGIEFYKIPDKVLEHIGFNPRSDAFNNETTRMLELKVFQSDSAKTMADRYAFFANHPDRPRKGSRARPFFQALSALTGAGKTPILAQAVALMRAHFGTEPIVLWMSKAKSVVAQTYTNFSDGGKYSEIIEDFRVINIQGLNTELIADGTTPLMLMTTIYANLTFVAGNKPDEVNLFSKGENDFDDFQSGNYQHIIFNLSLQEGWDDPSCYLAYIDKSMGSSIQVEQIIGRVLRQYGATHYENPLLNSAISSFA